MFGIRPWEMGRLRPSELEAISAYVQAVKQQQDQQARRR